MRERFSDWLAEFSGSWVFLLLHFVLWTVWLRWLEQAPYGLLTMVLSLEAIVLSTFVLMSQHRSGLRDRHEAELDRKRAAHVESIAEHLDVVHSHQLKLLEHVEAIARHIEHEVSPS